MEFEQSRIIARKWRWKAAATVAVGLCSSGRRRHRLLIRGGRRRYCLMIRSLKPPPHPHPTWVFEEGRNYDILTLLSSPSRDFLINNNDHQVKIDQLRGKHILLFFVWLSDCLQHCHLQSLKIITKEEVYNTLYREGVLEVVLVALGDNEQLYCATFSDMPWLAIPRADRLARDAFATLFAIPSSTLLPRAVLVAPDGTVVSKDYNFLLRWYGARGFPYTKEKIDLLTLQDKESREKLDLVDPFGDHLISYQGHQESTYIRA